MSDSSSELHAFLVRKTDNAVLLTNRTWEGDVPAKPVRTFWLPRSVIGRTTTLPNPPKDGHPMFADYRCHVEDWKVEQDNLWEFVKA